MHPVWYHGEVQLLLTTPPNNERGPKFMEKTLSAMHQALPAARAIAFEYGDHEGRTGLFLSFPDDLKQIVTVPLIANYPNSNLVSAPLHQIPPSWKSWQTTLTISPDLFPILRHAQFEDLANRSFADPIDGLLRATIPSSTLRCRIQISIARASDRRRHRAVQAVRKLDSPFFRHHHYTAHWFAEHITAPLVWPIAWVVGSFIGKSEKGLQKRVLETSTSRLHEREDDLQAASDKLSGHLFDCRITLTVTGSEDQQEEALDRLRVMAGAFGAFSQSRLATFHTGSVQKGKVAKSGPRFLLSHEELATLFHPPTASVQAERLQTATFTELEPPARFCSGDDVGSATLGRVRFRHDERLVVIDRESRRRHLYMVGATGAGKSTLLLNLIQSDMQAGRGLTVFDVHGDLADAVASLVPPHRTNDVMFFDAASENVIAFNPLACAEPARVDQVTSGVVSAFRKLFDSWGPRLENLLRYAVFATVEQGGSLIDSLKLLTDEAVRERMVNRIQDDVVRSFWVNEFAHWNNQYRTEAVSSVTNKVMPFLTNRHLRAIVAGSARSSLDLRTVMDRQQILIINISRGRLGQDNATLLGSLLLTSLEQAAMTRAELPEEERRDHYLYLDEFQTLATPSTGIMLSESRKYRLCLTLSHQLTKQLDEATWHSVIGNVGTMISFRVGSEDAAILAPTFSKYPGQLKPEYLTNLPNYTAYTRLLVDGAPTAPFSMSTLPPPVVESRRDIVIRASARQFARFIDSKHSATAS